MSDATVIDAMTPTNAIMNARVPSAGASGDDFIREEVLLACKRIPPLWDLPNYVAVNPFLGFAAQPLAEAAATIREGLGAEILPPADYYRARWRERAFDRADLVGAARRLGEDPSVLERVLDSVAPVKRQAGRTVLTHAERHDARHGTSWNALLINGAACWCAVHARQGGTFRFAPDCGDLYSGWREAAQADRSPEIAGLSGWRIWAKGLPCRAEEAIAVMLARLDVPPAERADYLYRLLGGVYGWASFLRRFSWESGDAPGPLLDLIAIRICADAAVPSLANKSGHVLKQLGYASMDGPTRLTEEAWAAENKQEDKQTFEDEGTRLIFQEALEDGFVRSLLADMAAAPQSPRAVRPAVQAVFCIDTRSEVLRRHLEAVAPAVETLGFAGFFGVSLSWQEDGSDSARCPVLLKPGVRAWPADRASPNGGVALKYVQSAPAASFTFVELLGLAYGVRLAGDASASAAAKTSSEGTAAFQFAADSSEGDAALEDHSKARLDLAAGILGNLGLRSRFGRLFLLCGHQGSSANNPHAASLDCGACGGHGGAINARVAAALLNDPAVRSGLRNRGFAVPDDTHFLPGVHLTATDEVTLLDTDRITRTHHPDLARLRGWLDEAAVRARAERASALGLSPGLRRKPAGLLGALRRRASDWSEVRPEWGLARNAAFIAARRDRTRGVDLGGRAFLHEYDWTCDPDNAVLGLILSAPMVVASWINLQYFASTVDNRVFGCGTKALHNRVEDLGVVLGNGGDLRPGLPLQSVHAPDGRWYHEPLRLQVIVEAPTERLDAALSAHAGVSDLVENGWVRLYALDPAGPAVARWQPGGWVV